jgi:pyruvate/2-oxoglutarate/acetoin dehydrogenase E1 component
MRELTGKEAIREALEEEMRRDDSVFLIGEDITEYGGCFGVTGDMYKEFGKERIINTPIAEAGIINASVGAAIMGMRPVCEIMFMDFITLAVDGLVNQAAKMSAMFGGQCKVPLVCRTPAGDRGVGGQHAQCLEAWFYHIPGLVVVMPSTPYDLKGLLKTSIRSDNPVVFVEHKNGYGMKGNVPEEEYTIPFGVGEIKRTGKDVTVVAWSYMVYKALEAAKRLAEQDGIDVEVIDPRTLVPLDIDMIVKSVCKTKRLVIVYEAFERGGVGSDIAAQVIDSEAFYHLEAPIKRVGGLNVTMPYTPALTKVVTPGEEKIMKAVREVLR